MPKLHFTNKAVEDLSDIWEYTFKEWSEKQADEYYSIIISACNRLLEGPVHIIKAYNDIIPGLFGIKAGHHLIFFRIQEDKGILIIRILHEKMDSRRHLK